MEPVLVSQWHHWLQLTMVYLSVGIVAFAAGSVGCMVLSTTHSAQPGASQSCGMATLQSLQQPCN